MAIDDDQESFEQLKEERINESRMTFPSFIYFPPPVE